MLLVLGSQLGAILVLLTEKPVNDTVSRNGDPGPQLVSGYYRGRAFRCFCPPDSLGKAVMSLDLLHLGLLFFSGLDCTFSLYLLS